MSSTCKLAISTSTTLNQTKPLRFFTSSRTLYSLENILPSKLWPNIILDLLQWQEIATLLLPLFPSSEHFRLGAIDITRNRSRVIFCRACVEIFRRWTKATVFPTCNSWLNFRVRGQFAIKTWIVRHINTTYFIRIKKNWTCACDYWKLVTCQRITSKILDLDGSTPEPAIRSSDTGQRVPCFDSCQFIKTLMSNMCALSVFLCLVPMRRLSKPSRSMHFGDVSDTNGRETPRPSRSAHAWAFLHFWKVPTFNWNNL